MTEQMEILLKTERKQETEKILQMLDEMTEAEQKEMLVFVQGVIFAKGLERKRVADAGQPVCEMETAAV